MTLTQTPIAVLGTLAEFHEEPIPYDLAALVQLVATINPDLLCLDMTPEQWQRQDFGNLPPEYAQALLPLARQTDMVVVPIAGQHLPPRPQATGWREQLIQLQRSWLARLQRTAPSPAAINQGWRHHLAATLYSLTRSLAGSDIRRDYWQHTADLTKAVVDLAQRDPGRRILVVVNVQHCHHIRPRLRQQPGIIVKTYLDL